MTSELCCFSRQVAFRDREYKHEFIRNVWPPRVGCYWIICFQNWKYLRDLLVVFHYQLQQYLYGLIVVFYYRLYWVMIDIWGNNETCVLKQNVSALIRFQCTSPTISSLIFIISLKAGETHMHQWTGSFFVQAMACRLFGSKLLQKPTLNYCYLKSFLQTLTHWPLLTPYGDTGRGQHWFRLVARRLYSVKSCGIHLGAVSQEIPERFIID